MLSTRGSSETRTNASPGAKSQTRRSHTAPPSPKGSLARTTRAMSAMSAARAAHASAAPRARAEASERRGAAFYRAHAVRRARSSARASTTAEAETSTRMVTIEEMSGEVFPSNLRCALRVNVPVDEPEESVREGRSLSEYMRLPVDQYVGIELPMGAEMKRVPGDRDVFQLEIPGLKFLSLEVKPVVRVRVRLVRDGESVETWTGQSGFPGGKTPEWRDAEAREIARKTEEASARRAACEDDDAPAVPEECDDFAGDVDAAAAPAASADDDAVRLDEDEIPAPTPLGRPEREDVVLRGPCVLIEAISCRVEGDVVEELGVNDLFVFRGTTCFRWRSAGDDSVRGPELRRTGPGGEDESDSGHANAKVVGKVKDDQACISGWADIGVGVDPPGPFALLPAAFAEKVGDAVMRATLKALQTVFLKGLGEDYKKWASDEAYRAAREVAAREAAEAANL